MEKIKIRDLKTGQVLNVTSGAWKSIKKTGGLKKYEEVSSSISQKKAPKKAVKVEPKTEESVPKVDTNEDGKRSAKEVISAIKKAKTKKAIDVLIDGESRSTVLKAAQKRKSKL